MPREEVVYVGVMSQDGTGFYPPVGTIGKVLRKESRMYLVQWEEGSTEGDGIWFVPTCDIRCLL